MATTYKKPPMMLKPNMKVYLALLAIAIASMIVLHRCAHKGVATASRNTDTIDVAIEYSPLSLYTYGDSLGGFNYELLMLIGKECNAELKLHPIVSLDDCLGKLDDGSYDIVAAQLPDSTIHTKKYKLIRVATVDPTLLWALRSDNATLSDSLEWWLQMVRNRKEYKDLCKKYFN